jgi:plasmid stabilization system protein ParE
MKLMFSKAAVEDLVRLRRFIAEHNPEAAGRVSKQLLGGIQKLLYAPQIGRLAVSLPGEIREFTFGKYLVRYAVTQNQISILRIWHGKEDRTITI